jgi:cold shock CspA family protein
VIETPLESGQVRRGRVLTWRWSDYGKPYGFILVDDVREHVHVSRSSLIGVGGLNVGARVVFEVRERDRRFHAINVQVLATHPRRAGTNRAILG